MLCVAEEVKVSPLTHTHTHSNALGTYKVRDARVFLSVARHKLCICCSCCNQNSTKQQLAQSVAILGGRETYTSSPLLEKSRTSVLETDAYVSPIHRSILPFSSPRHTHTQRVALRRVCVCNKGQQQGFECRKLLACRVPQEVRQSGVLYLDQHQLCPFKQLHGCVTSASSQCPSWAARAALQVRAQCYHSLRSGHENSASARR